MMEGQHNHIPPHNSAPIPHLMSQIEAQQSQPSTPAAEKKKKVCNSLNSLLSVCQLSYIQINQVSCVIFIFSIEKNL